MLIKKLKERISNSTLLRNIFILGAGNIIAMALPIFASPILSRLYSPEEYAIFGAFSSVVTIVSSIIALKFDQAVLVASDAKESKILAKLCVFIIFFNTLLLYTILFFSYGFINRILDLGVLLWLVPTESLLLGLGIVYENYNVRKRQYKNVSHAKVFKSIGQVTGQISYSLLGISQIGLSLGYITGTTLSTYKLIKKSKEKHEKQKTPFLISKLREYYKYPLFILPGTVVNTIAYSITNIILLASYEKGTVGLYSFAIRLLGLPIALLGDVIRKLFIQEAFEELAKTGSSFNSYKKMNLILISFIPIFIIGYFIAPSVFKFVFGQEWYGAGEITRILIPMYFSNFIYSPLSGSFILYKKEKLLFIMQIILLLATLAPMIINNIYGISMITYLTYYSIFVSIAYLIPYVFAFQLNRIK